MTKKRHVRRPGFSVGETLISTAAAGMLLTGISSAIFFSMRASDPDELTTNTLASAAVAEELIADLQCATSFSERATTAVTFTVADRTGDGQPETVRYAWLGTNSTPGRLVRQINGGSQHTLLGGVRDFQLTYNTQTVTEKIPQTTESAEVELFRHDPIDIEDGYSVTSSSWRCQHFRPTLPSDAVAWRPTRFRFKASRLEEASGTEFLVQLRPVASALYYPSNIILEQYVIPKASLGSSFSWLDVLITGTHLRSPKEGLCLVFRDQGSSFAYLARKSNTIGGAKLSTSSDQGATWSDNSSHLLAVYVYGTYSQPAPPLIKSHLMLTSIRASIATGGGAQLQTGVHLFSPVELTP